MAGGVRKLLRADVAVGVTGAGGPEPQDGQPPGTVFVAVDDGSERRVQHLSLEGEPPEVVMKAAGKTLEMLVDRLEART
jgi:nicotinamide-nucleotide amidase